MPRPRSEWRVKEPDILGWFSLAEMNFVYNLVTDLEALSCLEIGTYMGRSAFAICSALRDLGHGGRLLCVDTFTSPVSREYFERDFMRTMMHRYPPEICEEYSRYEKYPTTLDLFSRVTMARYPFMRNHVDILVGDSRRVNLGERCFDFCLIDGDHTYEGVRADYEKVLPHLRRGGVIVFQDVSSHFPGVHAFVEELEAAPEVRRVVDQDTCAAFEVTGLLPHSQNLPRSLTDTRSSGKSFSIMNTHMNVVLPFHKGDQRSAQLLLEILSSVDDGIDATYYLQYGGALETLELNETIERLKTSRKVVLTNELPDIQVPQALSNDDPNQYPFAGNHTLRSPESKHKILQWNLVIFKYITQLEHFLVIEPDCIVLRDQWLRLIFEGWRQRAMPIFGHLKQGKIGNKMWPTHFAGCSVYNGAALRSLPLEKYFFERYDNPWWPLRSFPDTETANNAFWGPAFSGYDISYDYFLFALYFRELTGSNNPDDWPLESLESCEELILCDFRSRLTTAQILHTHFGKLPLLHGVKDDAARHAVLRLLRSKGVNYEKSYPLGGRVTAPAVDLDRPVDKPLIASSRLNERAPDNSTLLSLSDLRNRYVGEQCYIIGNGPSIKQTDLSRLKNAFTFGLNRIYLNYPNMGFQPTFYCCVNPNVIEQFSADIDRLNSVKFINARGRTLLQNHWNTFFMESIPRIGFNEDLSDFSWYEGWTVTYCTMQVAFHLGFEEVVLVGVDHYFKNTGEPNKAVVESTADVNHFHPDYFGKGVVWQYPDLARSEQSYTIAKGVFERQGRRILDATIGGHLQIFPKVSYEKITTGAVAETTAIGVRSRGPTVSIIMPAYNAVRYIGEAIASVQAQSFENWELLVIDDGSTDKTATVVENVRKQDPRVRLLKNDRKGVSSARNKGLECARGEFIGFLDADDAYYPEVLARRVEALRRNPDWRFVFCVTEFVDGRGRKLGVQLGNSQQVTFRETSGNPIHLNGLLGRAEVFGSMRFLSAFDSVEDWLFVAQLLRRGEVFHKVDSCSAAYRIHDATVRSNFLAHANKVLKVLDWVYSPSDQDFPAAPEFAPGLSIPPKQVVVLRRRVGLLTWLLLERRVDDIVAVVEELRSQDFSGLSRAEIQGIIRSTALRFYICPIEETQLKLWQDSESILNLLEISSITSLLPRYAEALQTLIKEGAKAAKKRGKDTSDENGEKAFVKPLAERVLLGPYARNEHAHFEETRLAVDLLADLPAGSVMIDVGAHRGSSLSPFLRKGWKVLAFEPDPKNCTRLKEKFGSQPLLTIDIRAVGEKPANQVPFYTSEESTGISSLSAFTDGHRQAGFVSVTTVANIVQEQNLSRIDFLKIDTEGHDLMVLKGVPWDNIKPRVIVCEFEDRKTVPLGYNFYDLAQFLVDQGYWVLASEWYPIIRYGIKHDWRRLVLYPCHLVDGNAWGNLIAFREVPDITTISTLAKQFVTFTPDKKEGSVSALVVRETQPEKQQQSLAPQKEKQRLSTVPIVLRGNSLLKLKMRLRQGFNFASLLYRRLTAFYLRWPGLVAAAIIGLNTAAVAGAPFGWLFIVIGNALLLLLIGHAATRPQQTADLAQHTANQASQTARAALAALDVANKALDAATAAREAANQATVVAEAAERSTREVAETAGAAVATAQGAAETATAAREAARQASETSATTLTTYRQSVQKLNVLNAAHFQVFARHLADPELERLCNFWIPLFDLKLDRKALGYLAHHICLTEDACSGRLATNVQDMLLRVLLAHSIPGESLSILEIGALFGVDLAALYDACRGRFPTIHLTAIDPLEGYYGKEATDLITKVPINREIFAHNMRRMDIPAEDITLIQMLSTNKVALEKAADRNYHLLIIDGDHSYQGVKFDFDHYSPLVAVGGYIIFDDYSAPQWPEVTDFVDKEVRFRSGVRYLGANWRTAVFQVVRQEPSES